MEQNQRIGVLAFVMVVVVGGAVATFRQEIADAVFGEATTEKIEEVLAPSKRQAPRLLAESTREERRKYVATYGLRPDQRFLLAVGNLTRANGAPEPQTTGTGWLIPTNASKSISLSLYPTFEEMTLALTELSGGKPPTEDGSLESPTSWLLSPDVALRHLRNEKDPQKRARALLSLTHEQTDLLGVGDALPAEAWEALVRAEISTKKKLIAERALLARCLGYAAQARDLAEKLPPDPLTNYLRLEEPVLGALDTTEKRLLAFRNALPRTPSDSDKYFRGLRGDEWLTPHAYASRSFPTARLVATTCGYATLDEMREWAGERDDADETFPPLGPSDKLVRELREYLARRARNFGLAAEYEKFRNLHPEMFESPAAAAFLDSRVASCSAARVRYLVDLFGETDAANETLLQEFEGRKLPLLRDLHGWVALKLAGAARVATSDRIAETLDATTTLGGGAAVDALKAFTEMADFGDRNNRFVAIAALRRLDSRPEYALAAARYLAPIIVAPELHQQCMDHWVSAAGITFPSRKEDWESRTPLKGETAEDVTERRQREQLPRLRANYEADPNNWDAMNTLSRNLPTKSRKEGIELHRKWLQKNGHDGGLLAASSQERLLHDALDRGDLDEARLWAEILKRSYKLSSIKAAYRFAVATEDWDPAEELVKRALTRYEQNREAIKLALRFYFAQDRMDDAIELIQARNKLFTLTYLCQDIGPIFAQHFEKRPVGETQAAIAKLQRAKLDSEGLACFGRELGKRKAWEHAVAVHLSIVAPSPVFKLLHRIRAYPHMQKWKGKKEALSWLKKEMPPRKDAVNTMLAFAADEMHLSYELDEELAQQKGEEPDYVWLMRGAENLRTKGKISKKVADRLALGGDNLNGKMGQFLIGTLDEKALLREVKDAFQAGEVAYFLALKAQVAGKQNDALLWFRASKEAGNLFSNGTRESINQVYLINKHHDYGVL